MFSVETDKSGTRLTVTIKGRFDLNQAEQLYGRVQEILPEIKKGFTILTDLTSLEHMEADTKPFIKKTMDLLNKHGVSKVVRIIPDEKKDIGFSIMSLFHYSSQVPIHTYKSFQQAKEHL